MAGTMTRDWQAEGRMAALSRVRLRGGGTLLAFALGLALALGLLATTDGFVSNDDYYHARLASEIIAQGSLRPAFPWLPLTLLGPEQFVDHHLLYHIYLAPFAHWGGIGGAKLAQALVIGGLLAAFWCVLRALTVRWPVLWLIALAAASAPFLYRLMMVRTQAAAVLVLLLALLALLNNRPRWLLPLGFAFTWLYNGFILLPLVAGLHLAAVWLTERRWDWAPLGYALAGVAAGLVINPYFPQNIAFILDHLGEKVDVAAGVRVGNEWYPYTTGALLEHSPGMLLALAAGVLAPSLRRGGRDRAETLLLMMALVTLYMAFESRRFIEYAPVFAVLFGAAALGREGIAWEALAPRVFQRRWLARLMPVLAAVPLLALAGLTVQAVREDIAGADGADTMAGAAAWLAANTPLGSMVFQTDWDDFPYLFYHNTHNTYLVGMDPTYLQVAEPRLWDLWVPITQGLVERPSILIRETFGASFVVSDTRHDGFIASAEGDPAMTLVYRDAHSLVWEIHVDHEAEN